MLSASVCMATYNGEKYIRQQIESILLELDPADELLIFDDLSTDSTASIAQEFVGGNVKLYSADKNLGVVKNFKSAIRNSSKEIIVLCDQDDVWKEGRLAEARILHEKGFDMVMVNANIIDDGILCLETVFDFYPPSKNILQVLLKNNFVGCLMSFKADAAKKYLGSGFDISPMHDWYLAAKFISGGKKITFVDIPLVNYRRHSENHSMTCKKSNKNILEKIKSRLLLIRAVFFES